MPSTQSLDGRLGSYGEVARAFGLTESRITQITSLLELSPVIQERILIGAADLGVRSAMRAARQANWEGQSEAFLPTPPAQPPLGLHRATSKKGKA